MKYFEKGKALSDFLANCLKQELPQLEIITPLKRKGCQLSVFLEGKDKSFIEKLNKNGIIAGWRSHPKGGILRVAPVPLYTSFEDCWTLVNRLKKLV